MSLVAGFLELHELDQLLAQAADPARAARWHELGFSGFKPARGAAHAAPAALVRERERLAESLDRRWLSLYARCLGRYGRGLSGIRQRVCLGCHLTLPTSAAPPPGEAHLHLCEGCGRVLLWE